MNKLSIELVKGFPTMLKAVSMAILAAMTFSSATLVASAKEVKPAHNHVATATKKAPIAKKPTTSTVAKKAVTGTKEDAKKPDAMKSPDAMKKTPGAKKPAMKKSPDAMKSPTKEDAKKKPAKKPAMKKSPDAMKSPAMKK